MVDKYGLISSLYAALIRVAYVLRVVALKRFSGFVRLLRLHQAWQLIHMISRCYLIQDACSLILQLIAFPVRYHKGSLW